MSGAIVIRNGTVIDGTRAEPVRADVAIEGGRIIEVGNDISTGGAETIDAAGKVVAPGFIDIKTHSDWTLPLMPQAESKIRQGVTTEVIGHCGYSCAPALPDKVDALAEYLQAFGHIDKPIGMVILDLDHFKAVNDTHGHDRQGSAPGRGMPAGIYPLP